MTRKADQPLYDLQDALNQYVEAANYYSGQSSKYRSSRDRDEACDAVAKAIDALIVVRIREIAYATS